MNEVKKPRKPLMFYYGVAMVILLLFNLFAMPMLQSAVVTEVDYGTFMTMTQEKNIGKVEIQYNQIIFTDKADETIYKTGVMNDPNLTERLYNAGAVFASPIAKEASPIISFLMSWIQPTMFGRFYGGGIMPTPNQHREDTTQKLSVMVVHDINKLHALVRFPSIFKGEHVRHKKYIDIFEGNTISVTFDRPTPLQIDGELIRNASAYTASVSLH